MSSPVPEYLAHIWRQLVERAGVGPMLHLAAARGGTRIYVPQKLSAAGWLVDIMGEPGAAALIDLYGGEFVTLPADPNGSTKSRLRRMDRAIADGHSATTVARMVGVTERTVYYRKARHRNVAQGEMFKLDKPAR